MVIFDFDGQDLLKAPLSRERFALALRRGHGRALLHVRKLSLSDVADLVLEACLHNQTYDPQCEDSRALWLFEMFRDAPEYAAFSKAICESLESAEVVDPYDLSQLCDLAALMAQNGDGEARRALRSRVLRQVEHETDKWVGCYSLVQCEGIPALIELARRFGAQLRAGVSDFHIPVLYDLHKNDSFENERAALAEAEANDPDVRAWCDLVRGSLTEREEGSSENLAEMKRVRREQYRAEHSIDDILADATALKDPFPRRYAVFGSYATDTERERIFQTFLAEKDDEVRLRLLWVFTRAEIPQIHPRIWECVESENPKLRDAALTALSWLKDEAIGEYARNFLESGRFTEGDSEILGLFARNLKESDVGLIVSALEKIEPSNDNAHAIGNTLLNVFDENELPYLCELLDWVYENTPCSACRRMAFQRITEVEIPDDDFIAECLCDVDEDTRALAHKEKEIA